MARSRGLPPIALSLVLELGAAVALAASNPPAPASPGWLAQAQREIAAREYRASRNASGLRAPNRAQDLRTGPDATGVHSTLSLLLPLASPATAMPAASTAETAPALASATATPGVAPAAVATSERGATLPKDVPRSWWAAVQKDLQASEYEVSVQPQASCAPEGYTGAPIQQAPNRAHDLRTCFSSDGVYVVPRSAGAPAEETPAWRWGLKLLGYGDANALLTPAAAAPVANGNRVEYARGALTEWYVNDARGLEQGFTLQAPVGRSHTTTLRIGFPGNLDPTMQGETIEFLSPGGVQVLAFGKLEAWDATGRALPASMTLTGDTLDLTVDTREARYPVTVDPLATSAAWTAESDQVGAYFATSVASAGDVNGDGYSDVIVGAFSYDNGQAEEGRAYVFLGGVSGLGLTAAWTAESDQAGAEFGYSVASAGDVNGDGYSDVIVGAQYYDNGQSNEGRAFVYLGGGSGLGLTAAWTAESDQANSSFGMSVASAGDVNGDGYSDVIVGAPIYSNPNTAEGRAYLYLGSASGPGLAAAWTAESEQTSAQFGYSVASAGDVNGDGYSDVIVGAPRYGNGQTQEGRAYVYLGGVSGLGLAAAWTAESDQTGADFGYSVATAGDVNGDGYSDVIVGAYLYSNGQTAEGRAYVYLGGASGLGLAAAWTAESDQADADFGVSVASAGDVNGDGYSDVIIGARRYDNGQADEGRAYVYLGGASGPGLTATWTAESNQAIGYFGESVATAGDVNGDGYSDVIVGAPRYGNGQDTEGRAYVYLGGADGIRSGNPATAAARLESDPQEAELGISVAGAGDVNGDGYADVIVGAPGYDAGLGTNQGAAFVFLGSASGIANGSPATAAAQLESDQADARLGISVAGAGDVNGDGYADVIVGAEFYDAGQSNEGAAFIFLGSPTGIASTDSAGAAARIESNQVDAYLGASVAGAGDVNGDGYADVIVGSGAYDAGQINEGAAFVFLGSASGIASANPATAAAQLEGNQAAAGFGAVASAGDVNGDGYADVIVGSPAYDAGQTNEGAAFVFLGSSSGIANGNPATAGAQLESNQALAMLGESVAGAGDVNGDGYADVIVGSYIYDAGQGSYEGAAFVFLGSATGIANGNPATAAARLESNQAGAQLGFSVAGAGDVNGDGYADVIVGANVYNAGQPSEGAAFVFLGSASGIASGSPATAAAQLESNQGGATLGASVASAGDVNGDGYADVIAGAEHYDASEGGYSAGAAFVFYGGGNRTGRPVLARQLRGGGSSTVVQPWGSAAHGDEFQVRMKATQPSGRGRVKLEIEACPSGVDFFGAGCVRRISTSWTDVTVSGGGVTLTETVSGLLGAKLYHWRARVLFAPYAVTQSGITSPPQPSHGPWRRLQGQAVEGDLRTLLDTDDDGIANVTDTDDDGDGLLDTVETDTGTYVSPTNTGSDPLDADSDDDGLLDGAEVALGTDPNDADLDNDTICDGPGTGGGACTAGPDNCPFISNLGQTNTDALPAGNACQCGDVNNDGIVNTTDVTRASESLVGRTLGGAFVQARCNVVGPNDGGATVCDVGDLAILDRFARGQPVTVQNACQAYFAP